MLVSYITLLMAASSERSAHTVNINILSSLSQLAHTVGNVLVHLICVNAIDRHISADKEKRILPQKHHYMIR